MSPRRWVLPPPITAGFALAFLLLLVAGRAGYETVIRAADVARVTRHDRQVLEHSQRVIIRLIEAETAQRGYLLTGVERDLEPYEKARDALPADLEALRGLVANSPEQERLVAVLTPAIRARLAELGDTIEIRRREGGEAAIRAFSADHGGESLARIRSIIGAVEQEGLVAIEGHRATVDGQRFLTRSLILTATCLGAMLAGVTLLALNRQTRRRMVSEEDRERLVRAEAVHAEAERTHDERVRAAERAAAEREVLLRLAEQARAEAEQAAGGLRIAQEQAESANRAKDEFLAVLSHEMRSPLHAMVGWLSILKRGLAAGRDVDRAIEIIERNVRLQGQIVNDLLDVSRIVSRKLTIEDDPVDLALIVQSAVETARPAAEAKGVALASSVATLPGPVLGDEQRLVQMAVNVVTNAVKFTPGGGQVTVTLVCQGSEATLTVADTGIGIAPDFLPHVFDQFRQADATSRREHGGLGIGLAIAKTLAELHGGRIEASSEGLGQGATFSVHVPLRPAAITLPAAIDAAAAGPSALQGLTVLLLEDDQDSREALCITLEHTGAHVHACGSTAEARRVMETVQPDVILSDVGMPGENGYDFARWVRGRAGDYVPAIAITGFASAQDREQATRSGFDDHLAKPVNADELIAKLHRILRRSGPRLPRSGEITRVARRSG